MAGVKNSGNKGQDMASSYLLSADRRSIQSSSGTECDTTLPKAAYLCSQGKKKKEKQKKKSDLCLDHLQHPRSFLALKHGEPVSPA